METMEKISVSDLSICDWGQDKYGLPERSRVTIYLATH